MSQPSPYSNHSNSSPEILNDSDLEDYNTNDSDSASLAGKLDFSTESTDDLKYDELAEQKLESCSEKDGFDIEYINMPNKSLKGCYQVFVKLKFTRNKDRGKNPIVTHGTGETLEIAKQRAAERARKHLELMLSVQ
ncbi:Hypothetical predicted protein [Paramuricea clavata]|uniref:Uncharacterized protein n=1 Tax=Paramuricea clavata TaxID=317549 RepID=A0A7D9LVL5_PARCT|nr:Hypothetical predicted protein [Paramuricea clavata]